MGHVSLHDYPCCISHSKIRKKSRDRVPISSIGRNKLKRYPYEGSGCKFPDTFTQTISTCLRVPILAGAPPPAYPGEKPVDGSDDDIVLWEKGARLFVQYYSMLFLPFDQDMDPRDPTLPPLICLTME